MTVVIVARTFEDMTILADTRVSSGNNRFAPDSGIFKLIDLHIGNPPATIVFGFSGYLDPISKVLAYIIEGKLRNYKRRFVLRTFADEVRRWIQEVYITLSSQDQENFRRSEILLCGYEIYKRPHPQQNDPNLAWVISATPPPSFVFSYTVSGNGQIVLNTHGMMYIMGSGKVEHKLLNQFIAEYFTREFYMFNNTDPSSSYHMERSAKPLFFATQILGFFQHKKIISVGAPFQYMRLVPRNGLQHQFFWEGLTTVGSNGANVELINDATGQRHILLSLPQWVRRNGTAGQLG